jgi:hypothetical protein
MIDHPIMSSMCAYMPCQSIGVFGRDFNICMSQGTELVYNCWVQVNSLIGIAKFFTNLVFLTDNLVKNYI